MGALILKGDYFVDDDHVEKVKPRPDDEEEHKVRASNFKPSF